MNKIEITKKLVKECYLRSFFYRKIYDFIEFGLSAAIAFCIYYFLWGTSLNPVTTYAFIISLPFTVCALYFLYSILYEFISIVSGKFTITKDKVLRCIYGQSGYKGYVYNFILFEKYGKFNVYRSYFPKEQKYISLHSQLRYVDLGSTYYVVILKNKKIAFIFNSEDYEF